MIWTLYPRFKVKTIMMRVKRNKNEEIFLQGQNNYYEDK